MRAAYAFLYMLGVVIALMAIFVFGPIIETAYFPVYSKFEIVRAYPRDGGVEVISRFTKFRNCDPQGFAWFVGEFRGRRQLRVTAMYTGVVHRPLGTQLTEPFFIPELQIGDIPNLYAEIYHHCHPLWITRTKIYP